MLALSSAAAFGFTPAIQFQPTRGRVASRTAVAPVMEEGFDFSKVFAGIQKSFDDLFQDKSRSASAAEISELCMDDESVGCDADMLASLSDKKPAQAPMGTGTEWSAGERGRDPSRPLSIASNT